ncbi:hypothetical protein FA95DRAFT_72022 [Auriscalpium vulgare]|uniref:Uncharacterized protein n=1 Tax=Auriscalpium vulgare TaxID=40419 RepID=A0ACB8RP92_9AGAM|nr:hypothetical protein FA95DRAFT_72022 [Auriscalpium vulgare]
MASPIAHSDNGSRPKKRQRTDQDASSAQPAITKSDVVWMPDGNLIIRTVEVPQDSPTASHTLYRVHKSVLALHCGVFAAMFDGDQAVFEAASERIEGMPVMELPDAAEDVKHFLDAIYHPKQIRKHLPDRGKGPLYGARRPEFPASYSGVLRLATKYDAQEMREQIAAALEMLWPRKLRDWDTLESWSEVNRAVYWYPGKYIRLAKEHDILDVLPAMFYELAITSETFIGDMDSGVWEQFVADLALLTPGELHQLIIGKSSLKAFGMSQIDCYEVNDAGCLCNLSLGGCARTAEKWWKKTVTCEGPDCLDSL